jgi:hypothetical protein
MVYFLKYDSSDNRVLNLHAAVNAIAGIHAKRERQNTLLYNLNCHVIKRLDSDTNTREKKL